MRANDPETVGANRPPKKGRSVCRVMRISVCVRVLRGKVRGGKEGREKAAVTLKVRCKGCPLMRSGCACLEVVPHSGGHFWACITGRPIVYAKKENDLNAGINCDSCEIGTR